MQAVTLDESSKQNVLAGLGGEVLLCVLVRHHFRACAVPAGRLLIVLLLAIFCAPRRVLGPGAFRRVRKTQINSGEFMKLDHLKKLAAAALCFGLASVCGAQNAPATQTLDGQKPADQTPAP